MVGSERRERNNKFPTRTHGQPRGDTQLCWTRQDQLETRAGCTKSRRSHLAVACSILSHRSVGEKGTAPCWVTQRAVRAVGAESIFMLLSDTPSVMALGTIPFDHSRPVSAKLTLSRLVIVFMLAIRG
jgi:hypothetical protein